MCVCVWGGGGGGCTHYISMGCADKRDLILFSICWNGGMFSCKKSGKEFKYTCLERGSCLSRKGVVYYLI